MRNGSVEMSTLFAPAIRAPFLRMVVMLSLAFLSVVSSGCSTGSSSAPAAPGANASSLRRSQSGDQSGILLGAWVNPNGTGTQTPTPLQVITQTAALEATMPRPLALHLHYLFWSDMKTIAANPEILDDISHNRVPVISWHCKDDLQKPALDLNGIANNPAAVADVTTIGRQLALLTAADGSPYPILVRWFWEFNLSSVNGNSGINGNDGCFDSNKSNYPAEFIAAWKLIYGTLNSVSPRPNVSMLWNPNVTNAISSAGPYAAFYPGAAFVDWIGFDGYNKENASGKPIGFSSVFAADLKNVAITNAPVYGSKPILVGETGSCNEYADPNTQAQYLASVASTLKSAVPPWSAVSGFMYFDAPGGYTLPNGGRCTYGLQSGLSQWQAVSGDPYFEAFVPIP